MIFCRVKYLEPARVRARPCVRVLACVAMNALTRFCRAWWQRVLSTPAHSPSAQVGKGRQRRFGASSCFLRSCLPSWSGFSCPFSVPKQHSKVRTGGVQASCPALCLASRASAVSEGGKSSPLLPRMDLDLAWFSDFSGRKACSVKIAANLSTCLEAELGLELGLGILQHFGAWTRRPAFNEPGGRARHADMISRRCASLSRCTSGHRFRGGDMRGREADKASQNSSEREMGRLMHALEQDTDREASAT